MPWNDVLLVLNAGAEAAGNFALSLAKTSGAGLTAASPLLEPRLGPYVSAELPGELLAKVHAEAEQAARLILTRFAELAQKSGVTVAERVVEAPAGEVAREIARLARFYDVTIIDQDDPETTRSAEIIQSVLFGSGRPVLVVPFSFRGDVALETAVVAWDASGPAARALGDALPLLALSGRVEVVSVAGTMEEVAGSAPHEVVRHLSRHGISATARPLISVGDVANTLLSHIADAQADLLVMGAYGHSRMREMVLGGATRDILRSMTAPVLMSH